MGSESLMRSKCSSDQESASNSVYSNTSANSTLTMITETKPIERKG